MWAKTEKDIERKRYFSIANRGIREGVILCFGEVEVGDVVLRISGFRLPIVRICCYCLVGLRWIDLVQSLSILHQRLLQLSRSGVKSLN